MVWSLFLYVACLWSNAGVWNPGLKVSLIIHLSWPVAAKFFKPWPLVCPKPCAPGVASSGGPSIRLLIAALISLWCHKQASSRALVFCKMGLEIEIFLMRETCHLFGNLAGRFTDWKLSVTGFVWEDEVFVCGGGRQVGFVALQGLMQWSHQQQRGLGVQPWYRLLQVFPACWVGHETPCSGHRPVHGSYLSAGIHFLGHFILSIQPELL